MSLINIGCDDHIIDRYIAAIQQHKDTLFHGQKLLAYQPYLTEVGVVTAKEFRKIEGEHKRNRPKMEAIVELLVNKRDLQRFIGLSAVMFRFAKADADEMFPFVAELGDRHPAKGWLTVKRSMNYIPNYPSIISCITPLVLLYYPSSISHIIPLVYLILSL